MPRANGSNSSEGVGDMETDFKSISVTSPVAGTSRGHSPTVAGTVTGRELPLSPTNIAERRAREFMNSLSELPAKRQRLDNANKVRQLEASRVRNLNKIRKTRQRMRELHAALLEQETESIAMDRQIARLKAEDIPDA